MYLDRVYLIKFHLKLIMLLDFNKIEKIMSKEEREEKYSSDSSVLGTYVPNMSVTDMKKWKGKHIKGNDERVEIRKSINGTQLVIIVYKEERYDKKTSSFSKEEYDVLIHKNIHISANGKILLSLKDYEEMEQVIREAIFILKNETTFKIDLNLFRSEKALNLITELITLPKSIKEAINSLEIDRGVYVVKIPNQNGYSFAIRDKSNNVYSKLDKCFYLDVCPSSRDDFFFDEFRHNTIEEAIIAYFSNK